MRVALIYPPHLNLTWVFSPGIVSGQYQVANTLPLGILYLQGYLQARTGWRGSVLDLREVSSYREVEKELTRISPEVIGISVQTATLYDACQTARTAKKLFPEARVVFGGVHASYYPRELLTHDFIDFVIPGYGEKSFSDLVSALDSRSDPAGIAGLYYRDGQRVSSPAAPDPVLDLDEIPFPDRDLLPWKRYASLFDLSKSTSMVTSRGCPFHCIYCSNPFKSFRERSPGNIGDEIRMLSRQGYKTVHFWDETFNYTEDRALAICEEISRVPAALDFTVKCRVDNVTEKMIKSLKRAGCRQIAFGIESSSQKTLDRLQHNIPLREAVRTVELTRKAKIRCSVNFILGSPGESRAEVEDTIRFARKLSPDFAQFSIMTIYPGTRILEMARQQGLMDGDMFREITLRPQPLSHFPFWEADLGKEMLIKLIGLAYRRFYFRLAYFWMKMKEIGNPRLFWKQLQGAWSIAAFVRRTWRKAPKDHRI